MKFIPIHSEIYIQANPNSSASIRDFWILTKIQSETSYPNEFERRS